MVIFPIILFRFANIRYLHSLKAGKSRRKERNPSSTMKQGPLSLIDREFRSRRRGRPPGGITKAAAGRALGRRCATPSKTDRSVTRCLKMHHNYRGSPLTPLTRPRFLARVEYEAVGFPCIRYERFYLWLPAPGPNEL